MVGLLVLLTAESNRQTAGSSTPSPQGTCDTPTACQRAAKTALESEMARVGKDCPAVRNTIEENTCLAAALQATERNLLDFLDALEGIVGRRAVEASQRAWRTYRTTQCDAIADFYQKGTIAPSAWARCEIDLARSRMRELDGLFDGPLHH